MIRTQHEIHRIDLKYLDDRNVVQFICKKIDCHKIDCLMAIFCLCTLSPAFLIIYF